MSETEKNDKSDAPLNDADHVDGKKIIGEFLFFMLRPSYSGEYNFVPLFSSSLNGV